MTDTDQKLEDDVLRRMLATPPTPHKPKEKARDKIAANVPTGKVAGANR